MDQLGVRPKESAAVAETAPRPESPTGKHAEDLRRGLEWTKHIAPILETVEAIFDADRVLLARQAEIETTVATLQRLHEEEADLGSVIEGRLEEADAEGRTRAAAIIGAAETEMARKAQAADEELRRVQGEIGNANDALAALDVEAGGLRARMTMETEAHAARMAAEDTEFANAVTRYTADINALRAEIATARSERDALTAEVETIRRDQRAAAEATLRLLGSPDTTKEIRHEG